MTILTTSDAGARPISDLRILVVEDDGFQRKMLATLLHNLGITEVHQADCGTTALELLSAGDLAIDIIITDLNMPGMDGMEFIRHLGDSDFKAPLIISSALDSTLIQSVQLMTTAYGIMLLGTLEKPPKGEDLLQAIIAYTHIRKRSPSYAPPRQYSLAEISVGLETGQFEPYFQPKVKLSNGRLCGFEALARWRHPDKGVLSPYFFIENMESGGLIDRLTDIMLDKASWWCAAWRNSGLDIKVSVNLSVHSLSDADLADRLIKLVHGQGVEPRHIILEITETGFMAGRGIGLENLARLKMNGFTLSIDDYGTGYSSIQQLNLIAASELKIDRSFVTNAGQKRSSRVILQSSLEMAKKTQPVRRGRGRGELGGLGSFNTLWL